MTGGGWGVASILSGDEKNTDCACVHFLYVSPRETVISVCLLFRAGKMNISKTNKYPILTASVQFFLTCSWTGEGQTLCFSGVCPSHSGQRAMLSLPTVLTSSRRQCSSPRPLAAAHSDMALNTKSPPPRTQMPSLFTPFDGDAVEEGSPCHPCVCSGGLAGIQTFPRRHWRIHLARCVWKAI